jgi:hypothetical protein
LERSLVMLLSLLAQPEQSAELRLDAMVTLHTL